MDNKILVAGLMNIETNMLCEQFPIHYSPVRYIEQQISTTVGGVGYNIAKALCILGSQIEYLTISGSDFFAEIMRTELIKQNIPHTIEHSNIESAHTVVLYDSNGKRQINLDLKNIQEKTLSLSTCYKAIEKCTMAIVCNINFARPLLPIANEMHIPIVTDLHALSQPDDNYNSDFAKAAKIIFVSNENFQHHEVAFISQMQTIYPHAIFVVGMGANGALLFKNNSFKHFQAIPPATCVNTIGAGDALLSAFVHFYNKNYEIEDALHKAMCFASLKIAHNGAAEGFVSETKLLSQFNF